MTELRLPDTAAGKRVRCKTCQSVISVPSAQSNDILSDLDLEDFQDAVLPPQPAKPQKKKKRKWEPNLPENMRGDDLYARQARLKLLAGILLSPLMVGFGVWMACFPKHPRDFKIGLGFAAFGGAVMLHGYYIFRGKR